MNQTTRHARSVRVASGRVLHVSLEPSDSLPLYKQLYEQIRKAILVGRLPAGTSIPSTRQLAQELDVARSTAVLAYEQLIAENYVESRVGAGTRVSRVIPDVAIPAQHRSQRRNQHAVSAPPISRRIASVVSTFNETDLYHLTPRAFRCAVPAMDVFPMERWTRVVHRCLRRMSPKQLAYGEPFGLPALRQAVAQYLGAARGVRCNADQIMIVAGAQHALHLCAQVLLEPQSKAWVEDPVYAGALAAIRLSGAQAVPIPVDDQGLRVADAIATAPDARAAFVTPSRHLPLGTTLSLARRLELLAWARANQSWIVEDDYDSEFRYSSRPLGALQGLDNSDRVLYIGTFSKVMFPSLRLGYIVVPDSLRDAFAAVRHASDFHSPHLEQLAMAEFISEGHFEQHIRRMRKIYSARQQTLVKSCAELLKGRLHAPAMDAGLSLVAWLRPGDSDVAIAAAAASADVYVVPLSSCTIEHPQPPGLLLGFSGIHERDLRAGMRTLAAVLAEYDRKRRAS